ncbi:MAG: PDGLE domain-containing protein [Endomicrobium sp.]|jgi:cobalt/nickel transport protein|nr:PDGLE domain-containing protein [Endomicrobium sp.]
MKTNKKFLISAAGIPALITLFASFLASSHPDALESIAIKYGFDEKAAETKSFFTDYSLSFIGNEFLSALLAGIIGIILLYVLYETANFILKRKNLVK